MSRTTFMSGVGQNRWVLGARPRTLPAAVVPVFVGTAAAWRVADRLDWAHFVLALVVALALQIATNYANDYSDGKRGTDDPSKRVGPVRLVGNGLATPDEVKRAMVVAFGVAAVAGSVLVLRVGWELVPVGVAAILAGYFYTGGPKPYGYLGLGEVFVFVFFGLVATVGSTYVQIERIPALAWGCAVICGCYATAMLVVNNLRDIPGDTISGKRTLAVKLGDVRTRFLYCALMIVPFLLLPFVAGLGGRPIAGLAFIAIIPAQKPIQAVLGGAKGPALIPVLGATGKVQLIFGVFLTAGLVVSTYI
ncbi:MAG: 1,4-dihydroxy-2-naphthoate polyprenyltransferase [Microthrixaceae bacterium]|nr:1,4-dihydroxy-2-naphthoate polyprenyltransferase [Microthrixaceae bacterium]HPB45583.1 1,4-dihydroxy-2-naphthoate polyprenyltransferase [Microthrixaceae bacterium]